MRKFGASGTERLKIEERKNRNTVLLIQDKHRVIIHHIKHEDNGI